MNAIEHALKLKWLMLDFDMKIGREQCLCVLTRNQRGFTTVFHTVFGSCSRFCFRCLTLFVLYIRSQHRWASKFLQGKIAGAVHMDVPHSKTTSYSSVQLRPKCMSLLVFVSLCLCIFELITGVFHTVHFILVITFFVSIAKHVRLNLLLMSLPVYKFSFACL